MNPLTSRQLVEVLQAYEPEAADVRCVVDELVKLCEDGQCLGEFQKLIRRSAKSQ